MEDMQPGYSRKEEIIKKLRGVCGDPTSQSSIAFMQPVCSACGGMMQLNYVESCPRKSDGAWCHRNCLTPDNQTPNETQTFIPLTNTELQDENGRLRNRIEQLEIQLAKCSVAAHGWSRGRNEVHPGQWAYSDVYADVMALRKKFERNQSLLDSSVFIRALLRSAHSIILSFPGPSDYATVSWLETFNRSGINPSVDEPSPDFSDTQRLNWLTESGAHVAFSKDGEDCWLYWMCDPNDIEGHGVKQNSTFKSPREAIDEAMKGI